MRNLFTPDIRDLTIRLIFLICSLITFFATADKAAAYVILPENCRDADAMDRCLRTGSLPFIFIFHDIGYEESWFFRRFDKLWPDDKKMPMVYLESRGGNGLVGMEVGRILHKHNAIVATGNPFTGIDRFMCDSACSLIAIGAVERHLKQVGLHSAHYVFDECKKTEREAPVSQKDMDDVEAYLDEVDADPEVYQLISDTSWDQLTVLDFDENVPADEQLITRIGYHMDPSPDFPDEGFKKAPKHGEKTFEDVAKYAVAMGSNEAILGLASYYLCEAKGKKPDYQAAEEVLRLGDQKNIYEATYRLAKLYEEKKLGHDKNKRSLALYQQGAAFGYSPSAVKLAWIYYNGRGVRKDYAKARYWFNEAAKAGNFDAYGALCKMHFKVKGVERDDVETYKWCDLAIATLRAGPEKNQAVEYMHRLAERMSDEQIDQAMRKEESYHGYNRDS
jgi:Sel1 repeat